MKNSYSFANEAALTWGQPAPVPQSAGVADLLRSGWERLRNGFRRVARPRPRDLNVADIAHLGDKRFIALVKVGQLRFLVGGCSQAMNLLAKLPPDAPRKSSKTSERKSRQVARKPLRSAHKTSRRPPARYARQVAPHPPAKRNPSKRKPSKGGTSKRSPRKK